MSYSEILEANLSCEGESLGIRRTVFRNWGTKRGDGQNVMLSLVCENNFWTIFKKKGWQITTKLTMEGQGRGGGGQGVKNNAGGREDGGRGWNLSKCRRLC